jgi:hypothetical protein
MSADDLRLAAAKLRDAVPRDVNVAHIDGDVVLAMADLMDDAAAFHDRHPSAGLSEPATRLLGLILGGAS